MQVVIPFIRITRYPYEEPYHLNLVVEASNGRQRGALEIYAKAEDLSRLARDLRGVLRGSSEAVQWELGSERPEDRFAFYYRFRIVTVSGSGRCTIDLRFNNNQRPPEREISEFSIEGVEPTELDRLAELLRQFSRLEHRVLEWTITDGDLT
ncbi:MAG: hypothetical protein AAF657_10225 [Acidobacteriota bacterium]